jgi:hypothetical protein
MMFKIDRHVFHSLDKSFVNDIVFSGDDSGIHGPALILLFLGIH